MLHFLPQQIPIWTNQIVTFVLEISNQVVCVMVSTLIELRPHGPSSIDNDDGDDDHDDNDIFSFRHILTNDPKAL